MFSNKILSTRQSVISQLERVKGRDTRDVFRGNLKRGLEFQDAFLPFVYISILRYILSQQVLRSISAFLSSPVFDLPRRNGWRREQQPMSVT